MLAGLSGDDDDSKLKVETRCKIWIMKPLLLIAGAGLVAYGVWPQTAAAVARTCPPSLMQIREDAAARRRQLALFGGGGLLLGSLFG